MKESDSSPDFCGCCAKVNHGCLLAEECDRFSIRFALFPPAYVVAVMIGLLRNALRSGAPNQSRSGRQLAGCASARAILEGRSGLADVPWALTPAARACVQAEVRQAVAAREAAEEGQAALQLLHEAEMRHLQTEHAAQFASARAQVGRPRRQQVPCAVYYAVM